MTFFSSIMSCSGRPGLFHCKVVAGQHTTLLREGAGTFGKISLHISATECPIFDKINNTNFIQSDIKGKSPISCAVYSLWSNQSFRGPLLAGGAACILGAQILFFRVWG